MDPIRNSTTLPPKLNEIDEKGNDNLTIRLSDFIKEEDLVCPITLEVMVEPLKLFPCGHDVETGALEKWKKTASKLANCCPACKKEVKNTGPDYFLKEMISRYNRLRSPFVGAVQEKDPEAVQLPVGALQSLQAARKFSEEGFEQKALDLILELQDQYPESKDLEKSLDQVMQKIEMRKSKKRVLDLTGEPDEAPESKRPRVEHYNPAPFYAPPPPNLTRNANGKYSIFKNLGHLNHIDRLNGDHWDIHEEFVGKNSILHFVMDPSFARKYGIHPNRRNIEFPNNFHSLLFEIGADINKQNAEGDTPLHIAARAGQKADKLIRFLLKKGARCDIRNREGQLAEECTSSNRKISIFRQYRPRPQYQHFQQPQYQYPQFTIPQLPEYHPYPQLPMEPQEDEPLNREWLDNFFS